MTTNENSLPLDGDIRPLDNHASGIEIKPLDPTVPPVAPGETPLDNHASGEEIETLDNHASGPRP
ncbi:sigma-like protein [Streptomyces sp. NBC_00249]|uniref:sigma-like protein n=1 Tax=Streptomyces sp. NBC_00249 TaxID=2975690 RepID=UPI0022525F77|nr:sigma-like protein [Streptomyces sp. NBC_00249]MCX5198546.1 sigma-like protein [Streptomyces sp. NBC_00249]